MLKNAGSEENSKCCVIGYARIKPQIFLFLLVLGSSNLYYFRAYFIIFFWYFWYSSLFRNGSVFNSHVLKHLSAWVVSSSFSIEICLIYFVFLGDVMEVELSLNVDKLSAPLVTVDGCKIEDILVLHLIDGKDFFVSFSRLLWHMIYT